MNFAFKAFIIFILTLIYSLLRYLVFGPNIPEDIPLYIMNKVCAFSSIFYLGASILSKKPSTKANFGKLSFTGVLVHMILSVIVLDSAYFPDFYNSNGSFDLYSAFALLFAALGFALFLLLEIKFKSADKTWNSSRILYFILILSLAHVSFLGVYSWMDTEKWYGYLPPISMLSSLILCYVLASFYVKRTHNRLEL